MSEREPVFDAPWFLSPNGRELAASPFVQDQLIARLRDHVSRIAAQDWDYFADLRFRSEARQAVSDLDRLVAFYARAANRHSEAAE